MIELLVVIAIVSLMSSIVFASLNSARGKARDAKRMSDLRSINLALELYYDKYGTYRVVDTNWLGGGEGFVAWEDGLAYTTATTRILNQEGFLSAPRPDDPTQFPGYMLYIWNNNQTYSLSATKENPTPRDIAYIQTTCNGVSPNGTFTVYGKNYALGN